MHPQNCACRLCAVRTEGAFFMWTTGLCSSGAVARPAGLFLQTRSEPFVKADPAGTLNKGITASIVCKTMFIPILTVPTAEGLPCCRSRQFRSMPAHDGQHALEHPPQHGTLRWHLDHLDAGLRSKR